MEYKERFKDFNENQQKILKDNYDCSIERLNNIIKLNLELLDYYLLNEDLYTRNECYRLLQDIIAYNLIIKKKLELNAKRKK